MCARLETASSAANLSKYGPKPFELVVEYPNKPTPFDNCIQLLSEAENVHEFNFARSRSDNEDLLSSIKDRVKKTQQVLETLGTWACYRICHRYADEFKKRQTTTFKNRPREQLIAYATTVFQQCLAHLEHLSKWAKNQEDMGPYATEQVHRIVEILFAFNAYSVKERPLSSIIFVRERHIAFLLSVRFYRMSKNCRLL